MVHRGRFGGLVALTVSLFCSLLVVLAFVLDFDGVELALLAFAYPLLISVPAAVVMLRNSRLQETRARTERRIGAMTAITLAGACGATAAIWAAFQTSESDGGTHFGLAMVAVTGIVTAVITGVALIAVLRAPRRETAR